MDMEKPSEPDSTTLEKDVRQEFSKDKLVLFLKKDGCFYLGTVVQVDSSLKKCLVKFMDDSKSWCPFKDLKNFAPQENENENENETCYVCKKSDVERNNKILVCKCGTACHQLCHQPRISNSTTDWVCKTCEPPRKFREEKPITKKISSSKKAVSSHTSPTSLTKLSYNLNSLTWDSKHQVNKEGRYCYCGENGDWNDNMLQCKRCRQWFHVKCSTTVSYPILRRDKYFEFTCSICNRGKEKYKRLAMKWPDLVELVGYNLSLNQETKDYDIKNTILNFINKHWDDFMLPREVSKNSLKNILSEFLHEKEADSEAELKPLQNGDINSSEIGYRVIEPRKSEHKTVPPLVINVPKPYSTTVGDRDREVTAKLSTSHTTDFKVISSSEYLGRGLVKRSTPFPDQSNKRDKRFRSHAVRKASRLLNKTMKRKQKTDETSVLESNVAISHSAEEDDDDDDDESDEDDDDEEDDDDDDDDEEEDGEETSEEFSKERKRKMSLRTRVPEVRKRPQRNLLEARLNSTESKLYNPFTPVDISKTKKNKPVVAEPMKRPEIVPKKPKPLKPKNEKPVKTQKPKLVQKTIFDSFNLKASKNKMELIPVVKKYKVKDDQSSGDSKTNSVKSRRRHSIGSEMQIESEGDTSDDEASSRGTLEPFIPTPKDFEGQNNPFRSVSDLLNTAAGTTPVTVPPITLPLPLKTVIPHTDPPRLKKRQLSEEDIIIDRNGQVKRRRRQRKNRLIEKALALASASGTASKTAQIVPGKNNCVDYALSKRQLRARESMKLTEKPPMTPAKTAATPVKQSPTKEANPPAEDLESSVKYFFGAASRIASGEKYDVVAKRITPDGRLQCVVEWKGVPT